MNLSLLFNVATAEASTSFVPTLVVIALAFSVPVVLSNFNERIAIPVVVGEIFLGIVIGQVDARLLGDGTSILAADALLNIFYNIGLGYLFFLAGTEIDVRVLRGARGRQRGLREQLTMPLPLGTTMYLLTLLIGFVACFMLFQGNLLSRENWAYMALTLAPSSLGIIVSVLKEKGYATRRFGQMIFVAATVADFGTVLLLAVYLSFLRFGLNTQMLLLLLIPALFVLLYLVLQPIYGRSHVQQRMTAINTVTSPVKIRFALLIFLAFFVLSQAINVKVVLGTFLGGVLIKLLAHEEDQEVMHELEALGYGFFVPLFFITVGIRFDLNALLAEWRSALVLLPLLFLIAFANKLLPALLLRLVYPFKETLTSGLLLSARLSLMVAAAQSAVQEGLFNPTENAAIILLAMIMATIGPLIFTRTMPYPDEERPPPIVVTNGGDLGIELAMQLKRHGEPVVVVDPDAGNIERARASGLKACEGYLDRPDERIAELMDDAERFVSTYAEPDVSYQICRFVKSYYGTPHVVAEVTLPGQFERFQQIGVAATNPTIDRSALLALLARNPASYYLMTRTDDNQEVHEVMVRNPNMIGKSLREVQLPHGLLVMALRRRGELLVPNGDTRLEAGDMVTVVGPKGFSFESYQLFATTH